MRHLEPVMKVQVNIKNIEQSLREHNLIDNRNLWIAGFNDAQRGTQNAIAANLFYGNKRLKIVSVFDNTVYYMSNSKEGFQVYELGNEKNKVRFTTMGLISQTIELTGMYDRTFYVKVTKNKGALKELKQAIKRK